MVLFANGFFAPVRLFSKISSKERFWRSPGCIESFPVSRFLFNTRIPIANQRLFMEKQFISHHKIFLITVCMLYLIISASSVWACKCLVSESVVEELSKKDVVFLGKVIDENKALGGTHPYKLPRSMSGYIYRLKVEKSWKGNYVEEIDILSGGGESDCGYGRLKVGQRLLIYANQFKQASTVSDWMSPPILTVCSLTKPAESAEGDIKSLDAVIQGW